MVQSLLNSRSNWRMFWLCFLACTINSVGQAQEERYELGKRLRRFELAWQAADSAGRVRCVAPMQKAVQSFFSLRLSSAASELDQANFAVRDNVAPSDFERYAISRRLNLGPSVIDLSRSTIDLKLTPFYKVDEPPPADAMVRIEILAADDTIIATKDFSVETLAVGATYDVSQVSEGDFQVTATMTSGSQSVSLTESMLTRVRDVNARLERLEALVKERPSVEQSVVLSTDRLTCKQLIRTIRSQLDGQIQETDYPAFRLLKLCEALMIEKVDSTELFRQQAKQHDLWMTLSDTKKQVAVRVRCPSEVSKPMPVLLAFHGAGGSENMFFETYGAGRLVELAIERGWMVVAPRQGLLGLNLSSRQMLDVLANYYDIDLKQVYFVGHSMGAAQVMQQVALDPDLPAAAVAIGGGGRMAEAQKYSSIPWMIAAGEFDFGRNGAKSLADSLNRAGADVRYTEYPDVEHMVIVQAALDEVFKFLDNVK